MTEIPRTDLDPQASDDDPALLTRGAFLKRAALGASALFMAPNLANAAAAAIEKKRPPYPEREQVIYERLYQSINEMNHAKEPNIFFGAIMVPVTYQTGNKKPGTVVHTDLTKNPNMRGLTDIQGPMVLVNPVIYKGPDGRPYAVGYDRGDPFKANYGIQGRINFSNYDTYAKVANTTDLSVMSKTRFIDLGEVIDLNGTIVCFSEGPSSEPVMVKQKIINGLRTVSDLDHYPATDEVEGLWFGFVDGTQALSYLNQSGYKMMSASYKPPFYNAALKASKHHVQ